MTKVLQEDRAVGSVEHRLEKEESGRGDRVRSFRIYAGEKYCSSVELN